MDIVNVIYDYHFIIKEQAEWFEGQFTCLGVKYWQIHITFSVKKKLTKLLKVKQKL